MAAAGLTPQQLFWGDCLSAESHGGGSARYQKGITDTYPPSVDPFSPSVRQKSKHQNRKGDVDKFCVLPLDQGFESIENDKITFSKPNFAD